jgi:hypothetical protein
MQLDLVLYVQYRYDSILQGFLWMIAGGDGGEEGMGKYFDECRDMGYEYRRGGLIGLPTGLIWRSSFLDKYSSCETEMDNFQLWVPILLENSDARDNPFLSLV